MVARKILQAEILILVAITLGSCTEVPPKWDGKIYQADSVHQRVWRAQEPGDEIPTSDPRFGHGKWLSDEDFKSFVNTFIYGCVKWRKDLPRMSEDELQRAAREVNGQP